MITFEGMSREYKVIIFVLGTLKKFKDLQLVTGPDLLTPDGQAAYDQLVRDGFEPASEEIKGAMSAIQSRLIGK